MSDEPKPVSPGAYAANWRRIIAVDVALGAAVAGLGAFFVARGSLFGWLPLALGVIYVFAIVGRYRTWRERRDEAGIDD